MMAGEKGKNMTNEKLYEHICTMLQEYDEHTGNRGADGVIEQPEKWAALPTFYPFYAAAAELLIDARARMDTATTPRGAVAAAGRIVKNCNDARPSFKGIFTRGDKYCICDGFHLLRLNEDITSLPHVENDFDVDATMSGAIKAAGEAVELPSVGELRAFIANDKKKVGGGKKRAHLRTPYCLAGFWYCNAEYLLDMLQALPGCTAYKPAGWRQPLYFKAENGDGILLPVRPPEQSKAQNTEKDANKAAEAVA